MNRSLLRFTAYLQLGMTILFACGCAPTQPFFLNESPDLQFYLNQATAIEYPDVEVEHLAETTGALPPLTVGNHDYQFWNLSLEECVSIALQNSKFFITTNGNAEFRQNVAAQFTSGNADQFGSIYDIAVQQSTTQSVPLTVDGSGNRVLPRGVLRANQVGGVEDALAEFDAQASGFINYGTTDRTRNVGALNSINPQQSQGVDTTQQAAISKRMATGGVATLRQQVIYSHSNAEISAVSRAVPSDWTAVLEAQVQHPLMRNRGTLINRIPVVLASLNEDLTIADFEAQTRNLVRDVEVAYWNLYVSYRNVATAIIGRNSAIATAQFARLNLENGTGTRQELAQAVEQYYQFRGILESAIAGSNLPGSDRFGVYGNERVLRELMGITATDGRLVRPIDEPSLARVEFDWNESVAQMLYLSPEVRRNKTRIKQNELELMAAKNQILPEVNVSLLYRWVGQGDTLGPPSGSDVAGPNPGSSALGELTGGNYQEGAVRLEITPPALGARRELTRIRGAQLRLSREKAFLQEQERLLVSQLSDATAKVATHYQLVQTNAQRWQAAEQEVEARLAEFKGGRSPVNVVLQSQQRRAQAQIDYYRALGEYNKSINYVDYMKGTLLANSNITLAEGPWNKKAYWDALERARERSAGKQVKYGVTRPGVVRTGPVRDANAAVDMMDGSTTSMGHTMVPGEEFLNDPLNMNLGPYRDAIDVNDIPLGEMGSPQEMFDPGTSVEQLPPGIPSPRGVPSEAAPAMPSIDSLPDAGTLQPLDIPVGSSVAPMNYETESASASISDVDIRYAPTPVARRALPSR
ncbi:Outer membrane efflux protein [Novipirellula galeiformis]|uniref:Outer membrane efflux protein n=1 Tax=Novipirellula galeiformis TaxID=2528004 RepID=A0A5C6CQS2_9BACT|nr:TolC family protein [Novipirellula galeiformis]TWU26832.1 Outer membrane efflux protein [Novipirellula galeiformis]